MLTCFMRTEFEATWFRMDASWKGGEIWAWCKDGKIPARVGQRVQKLREQEAPSPRIQSTPALSDESSTRSLDQSYRKRLFPALQNIIKCESRDSGRRQFVGVSQDGQSVGNRRMHPSGSGLSGEESYEGLLRGARPCTTDIMVWDDSCPGFYRKGRSVYIFAASSLWLLL